MALYYWPLPHNSSKASLYSALSLAALSCIFRPTAAVMWVFLWLELALRTISTKGFRSIWSVIIAPFIIGTISVAFIFALDSLYYGTPTFTPLNFLKVNSSAVSLFYGSNPFHYYITQAIPILCTSSLPFVVHGIWLSLSTPDHAKSSCNVLLGIVAWTIGIYSLAGHKEWRFIHPLLPILHIFAARSLAHCYTTRQKAQDTSGKSPDSTRLPILPQHLYILLATIPASIYVLFFHSSGQISLVQHLRSSQDLKSVGFLMPCHSTPWQAYIHRPDVEMWALGCEPPLRGQDHATYYDQTRVFYEAPLTYLKSRFPSSVDPSFPRSPYPFSIPGVESQTHEWNHTWPSHIAMFGSLLEGNKDGADIKQLLLDQGYREIWSVTNGFEEDSNRRGGVHLWSWKPSFSGIKFNQ
ncbi:glycosylphosphatidylinositol anchor biosynthesis [Tulasnella sp. 418]|nr:glycosylphosphatidylinositol anchor biosynthesis [Tulasnella sp. 418]